MNLLLGIALAVAGLLLAIALVYGLSMAWRRALHDDGPLPLFGIIERRGTTPEQLAAAGSDEKLARAVRHCVFCGSKEQCRAWLASGRQDGQPAFCPNAGLFNQWSG